MADQIEIQLPKTQIQEGSALTATAYFRARSTSAASTPTTIKWRLDCLTTKREVVDWTTVSAASSASISITGANNAIQSDLNDYEIKQLTVMADDGLSTQQRKSVRYRVENLYGSP